MCTAEQLKLILRYLVCCQDILSQYQFSIFLIKNLVKNSLFVSLFARFNSV